MVFFCTKRRRTSISSRMRRGDEQGTMQKMRQTSGKADFSALNCARNGDATANSDYRTSVCCTQIRPSQRGAVRHASVCEAVRHAGYAKLSGRPVFAENAPHAPIDSAMERLLRGLSVGDFFIFQKMVHRPGRYLISQTGLLPRPPKTLRNINVWRRSAKGGEKVGKNGRTVAARWRPGCPLRPRRGIRGCVRNRQNIRGSRKETRRPLANSPSRLETRTQRFSLGSLFGVKLISRNLFFGNLGNHQ